MAAHDLGPQRPRPRPANEPVSQPAIPASPMATTRTMAAAVGGNPTHFMFGAKPQNQHMFMNPTPCGMSLTSIMSAGV